MPDTENDSQDENARRRRDARVRKDLLSPSEAKTEMFRRLANTLPDLPAFVAVIAMGSVGAALAHFAHLSIGEKDLASTVSNLSLGLLMVFGSFGAAVTVFLVAKTDTSKLIHCAIIGMLSGMAGPYLVMKAFSSVLSVSPELVKINAAAGIVESTTNKLEVALQAPTSEANPQKIIDILDQTGQAAANYLSVAKSAPTADKEKTLASVSQRLQGTLKTLNAAAPVAPQKSLTLITKVASEARDAGATDIAQEAQKIINTNSALQKAALSGKVYFIAPGDLTDSVLQLLNQEIKARFPLADIQPVVHPTRPMNPGLEIVYYRDLPQDRQNAEALLKVVVDYLKSRKIVPSNPIIRKGSTDQTPPPLQFDIHIGPDVASSLVGGKQPAATP
jgi:hypothetical protein